MKLLAERRLAVQQIARHSFATPRELVAWLGAVQAQDYAGAKWAVALRLRGAPTDASIERALADGDVLRTHALRGTWQLVAPADVRWILSLVAPRLVARNATRYRELALDAATFRRCNTALVRALRGGDHLTRAELAAALQDAGIATGGQRLAFLLQRAELEALVCSGARRGRQSTYALLDHRAPDSRALPERDQALAELAGRYFRSRGPATVEDFTWWSGLTAADAPGPGIRPVRSRLRRRRRPDLLARRTRALPLSGRASPARVRRAPRRLPGPRGGPRPRAREARQRRRRHPRSLRRRRRPRDRHLAARPGADHRRDRARSLRRASAWSAEGHRRAARRYGAFLGLESRLDGLPLAGDPRR